MVGSKIFPVFASVLASVAELFKEEVAPPTPRTELLDVIEGTPLKDWEIFGSDGLRIVGDHSIVFYPKRGFGGFIWAIWTTEDCVTREEDVALNRVFYEVLRHARRSHDRHVSELASKLRDRC